MYESDLLLLLLRSSSFQNRFPSFPSLAFVREKKEGNFFDPHHLLSSAHNKIPSHSLIQFYLDQVLVAHSLNNCEQSRYQSSSFSEDHLKELETRNLGYSFHSFLTLPLFPFLTLSSRSPPPLLPSFHPKPSSTTGSSLS